MAMFEFHPEGDLFESGAQALVNPVNCVGVMGAGLAKAFAHRFPKMLEEYQAQCARGLISPQRGFLHVRGEEEPPPRYLLCVATKRHWRTPSTLEDVNAAVRWLTGQIRDHDIGSVAIPALGCGLGGLQWAEVGPWMIEHLKGLPDRVRLIIHAPMPNPLTPNKGEDT